MRQKKVILWDNDGVLVNTEPVFYEANRRVLAALGVEATWAMFEEVSLRRGESLLETFSGRDGAALEGLYEKRDGLYAELLQTEDILVEEMRGVLEAMADRFAMGIVTSSRRVHFDVIHGRSGLLGHFDFVLTREDYAKGKPHPDGYLLGVERAGMPAEECIAVEDSPRGVEAALRAGIDCVLLGGGGLPETAAPESVRRAAGPAELLDILRACAGG